MNFSDFQAVIFGFGEARNGGGNRAVRIDKELKRHEQLKLAELGVDFYGLRARLYEFGAELD